LQVRKQKKAERDDEGACGEKEGEKPGSPRFACDGENSVYILNPYKLT
jgi:hypothetical protein